MKRLSFKILIFAFLSSALFNGAFGEEESAVMQVHAMQACALSVAIKVDSEFRTSKTSNLLFRGFEFDAKSLANQNSSACEKTLNAIISSSAESLKDFLKNPKDAPRALSFLKRLGNLDNAKILFTFAENAEMCYVIFDSKDCKLPMNMAFIALVQSRESKWLWDLSVKKTPLISLIAESMREAKLTKTEYNAPLFSKNSDIKFIDISDGKNADNPALIFYKKAQKEFYELNLPAYAEIMTDESRNIFNEQYLKISKSEQVESLKDYITYHKNFKKIADLGDVKIILFTREKDGKINSYDAAFIIEDANKFKLANFGQNQGALAEWLLQSIK